MYTIKQASALSGVGIPLLRAWERRYQVVEPSRSPSGYRLYGEDEIDRLRAMRALISDGWAPQQAAARIRASSASEVAALAGSPNEAMGRRLESAVPPSSPSPVGDLIDRLVAAARFIDADGLEAALDDAFAAARFETVADSIVLPALREIGKGWERHEVSVAGEHVASQAVLRRLAMAYEAAGDGDGTRPVLVGLGPGAHHEFGALAFATAARRVGLPVMYVGPDLPVDNWGSAVGEREARAAVIGVPRSADVQRTAEVIAAIRKTRPSTLVAVGGNAARRVARRIEVLVLPDGMAAAAEALRTALLETERQPA
jgi:MerR family transcriptional regulator, light-induced transcriptional regulator